MRKYLRKHYEEVLAATIIVQMLVLGGAYAWGIGIVANNINKVVTLNQRDRAVTGYNLKEAELVDFKDLR